MVCGAAMAKKRTDDAVTDEEAEQRATEALRRALATPYRPQKEMKSPRLKRATKAAPKKK